MGSLHGLGSIGRSSDLLSRYRIYWLCSVLKKMVPKFRVPMECFSCNPPYLNVSKVSSIAVRATKIISPNYMSTSTQK
jgi:hypothetical protein